jgi:RloB-like protein
MKSNRSYKRGEPHRDATYFVIACEGAAREKAYFERLRPKTSRLRFEVISPQNIEEDNVGNSSPKWVLDRVIKFVEKESINIAEGDRLWFVLDIDRWRKAIHDIQSECKKNGWNMALSNPCFEVWLWLHIAEISNATSETCQELKAEIHQKYHYNVEVFTQPSFYEPAIERARLIDTSDGFMPDFKTSKVYLLLEELFETLS